MNDGDTGASRRSRPGVDGVALANRVVKAGIGVALAAGVRRRDPTVVVNAVVSAAFTALPRALEARYGVRLRPWHRLWVSLSALVHTLGMLGPYDRVWWWDHLAHTLSGVVVAGATDLALHAESGDGDTAAAGPRARAATITTVTLALGVFWELLEYAVHAVADRLGFEPLLVHYGRRDTLGDLVFDLLGAGLVVRFGRRALGTSNPTASGDSG
ncbi:hypothetical protein [Halobacterium jilantaiense]|uniref:Uncharacterized protein n=1 Tax=Halobacterium jilantaiense TaxID=355548 RepID=A0A1I0QBG7_9EURY|nr:hypothetical protein [Halobacterium jilantaiense]SEW24377.1 hypothetical protein SAMN04487945_2456 [Halobacterium jilantaiense]